MSDFDVVSEFVRFLKCTYAMDLDDFYLLPFEVAFSHLHRFLIDYSYLDCFALIQFLSEELL